MEINKKYEDTFSLYLESIDKYIMDSIYKDTVNIQFEDCGVLLDNSLTTIQDEDLVFIKGE